MPLIPAWEAETGKSEFEASLVYKNSSGTGSKATQRNPVLGEKKVFIREQCVVSGAVVLGGQLHRH